MSMHRFPENWRSLNTTLCHDWLTGMRGGEKCLEILCDGFPDAEVVTLIHNREAISEAINTHPIRTSWLQRVPGVMKRYRMLLPVFPWTINHQPPIGGDLLISTSHCVAKALRTRPETRHLCYCFTPMRYAWTFQDEYFAGRPIRAIVAKPILAYLRRWDRRVSSRVDRFVAISEHIRKRIQLFYGRDADVVYPPVDIERLTPGTAAHGGYDLVLSALVPYKRIDLAVRAYAQLGYPLKIVGIGGELQRLKAMAAPNIEFLEWQSDAAILALYRGCRQLIFPGEEDFGIVPLEAQACGRPVVAFARGGALETIVDGRTGIFFNEQTPASLLDAVARGADNRWDMDVIRANAESFGPDRYIAGLARSIDACMQAERWHG